MSKLAWPSCSDVWNHRYTTASSRNAEPAIVYRKNLTLAYTRRADPHTPITRNIGTSSASKKTKNSNRSSARNEPRIAVSSSKVRAMNSRTR